jgi:hypothetical protein
MKYRLNDINNTDIVTKLLLYLDTFHTFHTFITGNAFHRFTMRISKFHSNLHVQRSPDSSIVNSE